MDPKTYITEKTHFWQPCRMNYLWMDETWSFVVTKFSVQGDYYL